MSRRSPIKMVCEVPGKPGKKNDWARLFNDEDEPFRNFARCRWTCRGPVQAAQFRRRRSTYGEYAVLHPSPKAGRAGKWQLSLFDKDGASGDIPGGSCDDVLEKAFGGRFPLHEARDWKLEHVVSEGRQLMGPARRRRR